MKPTITKRIIRRWDKEYLREEEQSKDRLNIIFEGWLNAGVEVYE